MLIYIVKHSEARPNVKGFLQGWISNPLNEKRQVTSRCHRPGNERHRVQCVYRKPYIACKKTAEIILRETAIICIPICFDDHIKGINMDDWEKKLRSCDHDIDEKQILYFFRSAVLDSISYLIADKAQ